ncbi:hypothetical protein Microterr_04330 [Microbacterium terricola]|uniref:Uncharacterized protein n=1 Tax=Microbacterium terricola TaxID=344163 RepID=A0ABM8DVU2_9MICO|nr:hypothetical protein Microterr_04330 [Microbacterium terricola]
MLMSIFERFDRAVWGAGHVTCEECGAALPAHAAVWRGTHPYCSPLHEMQDSDGQLALA